ncbi:MAG: ATP-binding protein, partial [Anaerolineales bacterium]
MRELSLHLLDLAENSVSANASRITIRVEELLPEDRLLLEIGDDGSGMSPEILAIIQDPFVTSR